MSAISNVNSLVADDQDQCFRRWPGRPQLHISEMQLSNLLEQEFTQVEIAEMLSCSPRTIHRTIVEFGLDRLIQYSPISDAELDELVLIFVVNFPTAGQKQIAGLLSTLGYRIQQFKIRDSLDCVILGAYNSEAVNFFIAESTKWLVLVVCGTLMAITS